MLANHIYLPFVLLQHNIDTWAPYHEPFKKAIELNQVNEAMAIWNEAAVKSLTELIPNTNHHEYTRGADPNIVNKPLLKKNTDDIRDKTQWHCNVIGLVILSKHELPLNKLLWKVNNLTWPLLGEYKNSSLLITSPLKTSILKHLRISNTLSPFSTHNEKGTLALLKTRELKSGRRR